MPIERKRIVKPYLILCEGKDAEMFLINYLESEALSEDLRFSNEIQVLDFGGNDNLNNFLLNLKNMDKFSQVVSLAVIRDAENDYSMACREVSGTLVKCGFTPPDSDGSWTYDDNGLKVGFMLFPLNNDSGTLEDLCLRILAEKGTKDILTSINEFLTVMESSHDRHYRRKHKNRLHTYLSSSDEFVTMPLGLASSAGAFNWNSSELECLRDFLSEGFYE